MWDNWFMVDGDNHQVQNGYYAGRGTGFNGTPILLVSVRTLSRACWALIRHDQVANHGLFVT
jgi:hypothetical protein